MQHFFVAPDMVNDTEIYIVGQDVNHMKNVLRMKIGEQVEISDGNNLKYLCEVSAYESDKVVLKIIERKEADTELTSRLYLFQGLPKNDKMELIVQKAVELGACEIIPVSMKRCVVKLDAKKAAKKVERWNSISESAAKQAGRSIIPEVTEVMSYEQALRKAEKLDIVLVPYELEEGMKETKQIIENIQEGQSVGIFIGPEGGFERDEIDRAIESGAYPVTLGRRILRTETAGLAILSVLMFHLEA